MSIAFTLLEYEPLRELLMLDSIYTYSVVYISQYFIQLIGIHVETSNEFIYLNSSALQIEFGCNGLEAILLFTVAVLAFEGSIKNKIIGIVLGSSVLQLINIARIVLLAYVLEYHDKYFEVMHIYVTQSMMVVLALVVFLLYLAWIEREVS